MYYADYKKYDFLNGVGIRHSLFVSGCTHYCKNCFNKKAWKFDYGQKFTEEVQQQIINDFQIPEQKIQGLSLLGGEPMDNAKDLTPFIKRFKKELADKDIWIWSGYTFEQIIKDNNKLKLLKLCDVLVDGEFMEKFKNLKLKFRGSENQRIIDVQKSLKKKEVILLDI